MPLAPLQEFHFDTSWPIPGGAVYMTANRVWTILAQIAVYAVPMAIAAGVNYG